MSVKIGIIGLGYVGLPLAVEFAKQYHTVGFDIDVSRIDELRRFYDRTLEVDKETLEEVSGKDLPKLKFTTKSDGLKACDVFIVTVPTPTDKNKRPDLTPLLIASETVGNLLSKGNYVVFESTVYPGVTEDECVPVLEKVSGLRLNEDFFVGYSPERINPGDKSRHLTDILKVTSGSTQQAALFINNLYKSVIKAGTHLAPSIKVAEASKVIENSQRDINIAFVNELAKIFAKLDIDTQSVLEAAGTKWNFLKFQPGLVGGHCIGVDPYYLAQKAQESGYYPEIILAGRRINDSMGTFVAAEIVKKMVQKNIKIKGSKVLILGFTFKENCPDVRNTRVIDIYNDLEEFGLLVDVHDPWLDSKQVSSYEINFVESSALYKDTYSGVILAVGHSQFLELDYSRLQNKDSILFDIKGFLPKDIIDARL